jgi:menaquinone-dependent protoporphyrinogen oxidase
MAHILIVYGTTEGHTDEVVEHIRGPLESAGHEVVVHRIGDAPDRPAGFDAVLVGSSIHVGKHHGDVVDWVRTNSEWLQARPSAFFQVSLSSASGDEQDTEARSYVDQLVEATGWHPDLVGLFGGALLYTRYGFVKRTMLKKIAGKSGLGTDTHRDYDYTDYDAVRHFAEDVAALLG